MFSLFCLLTISLNNASVQKTYSKISGFAAITIAVQISIKLSSRGCLPRSRPGQDNMMSQTGYTADKGNVCVNIDENQRLYLVSRK